VIAGLLDLIRKVKREFNQVLDIQQTVEKGLLRMASQVDELKAKLQEMATGVVTMKSNVAEIKEDFQELLDKIIEFGDSPTPEQMAELVTMATDECEHRRTGRVHTRSSRQGS